MQQFNTRMDHENEMYKWAEDLFPICRSLTGEGVRQTLQYFKYILPELEIKSVPSGTKVFDWIIPDEWNIRDAYVADENGIKVIDFNKSNLHVMGYSEPVNKIISLEELQKHLYSLEDQPDAIPYVTSYYKRNWGFCVSHNERIKLKNGNYRVVIDSTLAPGHLNYAEILFPGAEKKEVLLSTYICHPSMANNELSGPVVTAALAKFIKSIKNRRYTYRIVFVPETIGSITYLHFNANIMRENTIAGFVLTCVGDERAFSFLPSRLGNTLADKVGLYVLDSETLRYDKYSFLDRGSDERQYCSPGIDLPVVSIMRSKYETYPEYHTSLDNLELITSKGLHESLNIYKKCLETLERNYKYKLVAPCEPQLGKHGLYPNVSEKNNYNTTKNLLNLLAYADGNHDAIDISLKINANFEEVAELAEKCYSKNILKRCP